MSQSNKRKNDKRVERPIEPPPANTLRAVRLCQRCERPMVDHDDTGSCPKVTADTVTDAQIGRLRIDLRDEPVTAEGYETLRCCNVALDSRFGASRRKAARGHCAAVINARRLAQVGRS